MNSNRSISLNKIRIPIWKSRIKEKRQANDDMCLTPSDKVRFSFNRFKHLNKCSLFWSLSCTAARSHRQERKHLFTLPLLFFLSLLFIIFHFLSKSFLIKCALMRRTCVHFAAMRSKTIKWKIKEPNDRIRRNKLLIIIKIYSSDFSSYQHHLAHTAANLNRQIQSIWVQYPADLIQWTLNTGNKQPNQYRVCAWPECYLIRFHFILTTIHDKRLLVLLNSLSVCVALSLSFPPSFSLKPDFKKKKKNQNRLELPFLWQAHIKITHEMRYISDPFFPLRSKFDSDLLMICTRTSFEAHVMSSANSKIPSKYIIQL